MFENELSLLWISKESYTPGEQILMPHVHNEYYHYICTIEGSGSILVDDTEYPIRSGAVACVPRGVRHGFLMPLAKDYVKTVELKFVVHNEELQTQLESLCGYIRCPVPSLPETLVALAIHQEPYYEELIRLKLAELLFSLLKGEAAGQAQNEDSAASTAPLYGAVVTQAIAFMRENPARQLSLDELAAHCALSKHYFARMFKDETGESPGRYMSRLRIEEACRMMTFGEYNITQIATQLGFQNVHYFSRVFKQWKGVTPTEYVRTHNPALYVFLTRDKSYLFTDTSETKTAIIG